MATYTETSQSGVTGTTHRSDWTINNSNRSFQLSHTPDEGSVIASVNGFLVAFSVSSDTVTFGVAPVTSDTVTIHYAVAASSTASSGAVAASTIIQDAMRDINKLGAGQTIATADLTFGLVTLNDIIDHWRTKRYYVPYLDHNEYVWTTSQQSYSIGQDSADFEADRPIKIVHANLIRVSDDPDRRIKLSVFNVDEYAEIQAPAYSQSEPVAIYYKPTYPNGTIYPWPYPEDDTDALANKLELFTWSQLSAYANSSTSVDLAPGYKAALTKTLAEWIAPAYGIVLSADYRDIARQTRAGIASINIEPRYMETADYGIPMSEDY